MNRRGNYPPSSSYRPPVRPGQYRSGDNWQDRANRQFMVNQHNQQGMNPMLKAALIMLIPLAILHVLNAFAFAIPFFIFFPIEWIIYLICGYLGAKFFADSLHHVRPRNLADQAVKNGAGAGITLGVLSLIFRLIFIFALNVTVLNIFALGTTVSVAVCAPADVIIALLLGALGGKIFESSWR